MITILVPPTGDLARVSKLLQEEMAAASHIKSRVNRQSVQDAIRSLRERLKLCVLPANGLAFFCGTVALDGNRTRRVNIHFEPPRPLDHFLYLCDSRFHTEAVAKLLEDESRFGFIVMDGSGTLFGAVCGNSREVLHKFQVDLPKKHGRGGQSALRFARLRLEKRHNYLRKVAELATQLFLNAAGQPTVAGLIVAGSADLKSELLAPSGLLDPRVSALVLRVVDIAYGGHAGFSQAIALAADAIGGARLVDEMRVLRRYFDTIATSSPPLFTFGREDTLEALERGAVDTLLVWEDLAAVRVVVSGGESAAQRTLFFDSDAAVQAFRSGLDQRGALPHVVEEEEPLMDWLALKYARFGARLEIVSDQSPEGSQFVRGFGGLGAILRYHIALSSNAADEADFTSSDDEGADADA